MLGTQDVVSLVDQMMGANYDFKSVLMDLLL